MVTIALLVSSGRLRPACFAGAIVMAGATSAPAWAQKVHNTYGSPLDTLVNTHLTTDVPQAQDFVRQTSPDRKSLDYTPLTGADPARPKPRDPKQVEALQAELEVAGAKNEQRAKGLLPRDSARKGKAAKTAAAKPVAAKSVAAKAVAADAVP